MLRNFAIITWINKRYIITYQNSTADNNQYEQSCENKDHSEKALRYRYDKKKQLVYREDFYNRDDYQYDDRGNKIRITNYYRPAPVKKSGIYIIKAQHASGGRKY